MADPVERRTNDEQERLERRDNERNQQRVEKELQKLEDARGRLSGVEERNVVAQQRYEDWQGYGSMLGVVLLLMIFADATQIPRLVRRRNEIESVEEHEVFACPVVDDVAYDVAQEKFAFNRFIGRIDQVLSAFRISKPMNGFRNLNGF